MIYNNVEFHNVARLENIEEIGGLRLQRFPDEVRNSLGHLEHERGRFYSQIPVGCEIRFITEAKFVRVSLSMLEGDGRIFVYKGNFLHSSHILKAGVITTLHLEEPPKWEEVVNEALSGYSFSSSVWRIVFGKDCCVNFHHIETFGHEIMYPKKNEVPRIKWLAYGSSITFGGNTTIYNNAYVQQTARRLNIDVLNKGIAGSCFCDKCVADYIAKSDEWDLATLELGVNMVGRFEPEEFEQRATYLVKTIIDNNPGKPVAVISIFPNGYLYSKNKESKTLKNNIAFNRILPQIVEEMNNDNLYFIDGKDILTDFSGLSTDLLHPSDHGHIIMGENLSRILKPIVEKISIKK